MNRNLIAIGIVVILLAIGMSGCNELTTDKRFVGKWYSESSGSVIDLGKILTFYSDGTASLNALEAKWKVQDNMLIIEMPQIGVKSNYGFSFSNNGNTLTITNSILETSYDYIKQ